MPLPFLKHLSLLTHQLNPLFMTLSYFPTPFLFCLVYAIIYPFRLRTRKKATRLYKHEISESSDAIPVTPLLLISPNIGVSRSGTRLPPAATHTLRMRKVTSQCRSNRLLIFYYVRCRPKSVCTFFFFFLLSDLSLSHSILFFLFF